MGRIVSVGTLILLCAAPALPANDADLARLLKGIEQRYNNAKSLQVSFNETYSVGGRERPSESGMLTLRKPGRMRWDYQNPPGKLFLSDGKQVYLYTPQDKKVERMKLKETDDYRAPLAFLLGKLDFSREFQDFHWKPAGADYDLTAKARSQNLPYDSMEMVVTPDYRIKKLVVTGQDGSLLTFLFDAERVNPRVDDTIFRFHMPEGAKFADEEGE